HAPCAAARTPPPPPAPRASAPLPGRGRGGREGSPAPRPHAPWPARPPRQCRRLVDCEVVRIWIARSGGRRLVAKDFEAGQGPPREVRLARGEGLPGYVMTHGEALRLAPDDPRPPGVGALGGPVRSALGWPLYRRGEPFGAIECLGKRGGHFTSADFDRLEVAAESVSFALDYALLSHEIERRALEKDVLLEVTRTLAMPFELEEVVEAIFTALRQVIDFDAAGVYLMPRGRPTLEIVCG